MDPKNNKENETIRRLGEISSCFKVSNSEAANSLYGPVNRDVACKLMTLNNKQLALFKEYENLAKELLSETDKSIIS